MDIISWESYHDHSEWTKITGQVRLGKLCCFKNRRHNLYRRNVVLNTYVLLKSTHIHTICTQCFGTLWSVPPPKYCDCRFYLGIMRNNFLSPDNWQVRHVSRKLETFCCAKRHLNGKAVVRRVFAARNCKFHTVCQECFNAQMEQHLPKQCDCPFKLFTRLGANKNMIRID